MNKINISTSTVVGSSYNRVYSNLKEVRDSRDLERVVQYDHVCGVFLENNRAKKNFIKTDCIVMDVDNDHSNEEKDWVTFDSFCEYFKNVDFYIVPSRNNMKVKHPGEKSEQSARPRFHVYFILSREMTDVEEVERLKKDLVRDFPYFDRNCIDVSRFIYGNEDRVDIVTHDGGMYVDNIKWGYVEAEESEYIKSSKTPSKYITDGSMQKIKDALNYLAENDKDLGNNYFDWIHVGMACYNSGLSCEDWDLWSRSYPDKYKVGVCEKKWVTFRNDPSRKQYTAGTIFEFAKACGFTCSSREVMNKIMMEQCQKSFDRVKDNDSKSRSVWEAIENNTYIPDVLTINGEVEIVNKIIGSFYFHEDINENTYEYIYDKGNYVLYPNAMKYILTKIFNKQTQIVNEMDIDVNVKKKFHDFVSMCMKYKSTIYNAILDDVSLDLEMHKESNVYNTNKGVIDLCDIGTWDNPRSVFDYPTARNIDCSLKYDEKIVRDIIGTVVSPVFDDDDEVVDGFMRRMSCRWFGNMGYRDNIAEFLVGPGGNGKTELAGYLLKVFGEYGYKSNKALFDTKDPRYGKFMASELKGKLLTVIEEMDHRTQIGTTFKELVDFSSMRIEEKYKHPEIMQCTSGYLICTNGMPGFSASGRSVARRINVSDATSRDHTKEDTLEQKAEFSRKIKLYCTKPYLDQMRSYMLHLAMEEYKNNFVCFKKLPQKVVDRTEQYISDCDPFIDTVFRFIEKKENSKILVSELHSMYKDACEVLDQKNTLSQRGLRLKLKEEYGLKVVKVHGLYYLSGYDFKSDEDPDPEPKKTVKEVNNDRKMMQQVKSIEGISYGNKSESEEQVESIGDGFRDRTEADMESGGNEQSAVGNTGVKKRDIGQSKQNASDNEHAKQDIGFEVIEESEDWLLRNVVGSESDLNNHFNNL